MANFCLQSRKLRPYKNEKCRSQRSQLSQETGKPRRQEENKQRIHKGRQGGRCYYAMAALATLAVLTTPGPRPPAWYDDDDDDDTYPG